MNFKETLTTILGKGYTLYSCACFKNSLAKFSCEFLVVSPINVINVTIYLLNINININI